MTEITPNIKPDSWDLNELKTEFKRKSFVIPQFQRKFVWNQKRICDLVDSIYKLYPIGSFLFWNSDNKDIFKSDTSILPFPNTDNNYINYVLDGQQRLASLYGIIYGKTIENYKGTKINCKNICFDLENAINNPDPEEILFVYRKNGPDEERFFSLYDILDQKKLDNFCKNIGDEEKEDTLRKCHYAFNRDYKFSIIMIKNQKEDHLPESFVRVNDRGVKLDTVNLVIATAWRKDFDLQKNIDEFKEELPHSFHELNDEQILQALSLNLEDGFSKSIQLNLAKEWKELSLNKLKNEWKKNNQSIQKTIDYLHDNLGVLQLDFIPFGIMVSILSSFFYKNRRHSPSNKQAKIIEKWFWKASLEGRYSGAGFSKNVIEDKRKLEKLTKGEIVEFDYENEVKIEEIINTSFYRSFYLRNAFLCLLALQQPKRFDNGMYINLEEVASSYNDKQRHHIFPKSLLKKYFQEEKINCLCNICFIPADLNNIIKDKPPSEYLNEYKNLLGEKKFTSILNSHLIPHTKNSGIWDDNIKEGFKTFIKNRSELLKNNFEQLLY